MGTLLRATTSRINFSWRIITENEELEIPERQQMIVCDQICIEGCLILNDNSQLVVL